MGLKDLVSLVCFGVMDDPGQVLLDLLHVDDDVVGAVHVRHLRVVVAVALFEPHQPPLFLDSTPAVHRGNDR